MVDSYQKIKVLFVCMGNICRSPLAEGIFIQELKSLNLSDKFIVDSAGTSNYHVGDSPDSRALKVASSYGVKLNHFAREFITDDFKEFDYILVMDHLNYDAVLNHAKESKYLDKVFLFRTFDEFSIDYYDVPDPYYGDDEDFFEVGDIIKRASAGFIRFLEQDGKLSHN